MRQAGGVRVPHQLRQRGVGTVGRPSPRTLETVLTKLQHHARTTAEVGALQPAAVLVPLRHGPAGLELVLTRRASYVGAHGGQVSFPGGRVDPGDTDRWSTALREAHEEVGIPPEAVERIALLDYFLTVTRFHITPCVGLISPDLDFRPCEREVADVFTVPLSHFFEPPRRRTMRMSGWSTARRVIFYLTEPHVVWGATAAMIHGLTEVLTDNAPG